MAFDVSVFRSKITGDLARPNYFEVQVNLPAQLQSLNQSNSFADKLRFTAHGTIIPDSTLGVIPFYYFGHAVNFAGNRVFSEWTITVANDEDWLVRSVLEEWSGHINSHVSNVRDPNLLSPNDYVADAYVYHYSKIGGLNASPIKTYIMRNAFPTNISTIDLDWGQNDTPMEFTVTWAFDQWTVDSGQDFPA